MINGNVGSTRRFETRCLPWWLQSEDAHDVLFNVKLIGRTQVGSETNCLRNGVENKAHSWFDLSTKFRWIIVLSAKIWWTSSMSSFPVRQTFGGAKPCHPGMCIGHVSQECVDAAIPDVHKVLRGRRWRRRRWRRRRPTTTSGVVPTSIVLGVWLQLTMQLDHNVDIGIYYWRCLGHLLMTSICLGRDAATWIYSQSFRDHLSDFINLDLTFRHKSFSKKTFRHKSWLLTLTVGVVVGERTINCHCLTVPGVLGEPSPNWPLSYKIRALNISNGPPTGGRSGIRVYKVGGPLFVFRRSSFVVVVRYSSFVFCRSSWPPLYLLLAVSWFSSWASSWRPLGCLLATSWFPKKSKKKHQKVVGKFQRVSQCAKCKKNNLKHWFKSQDCFMSKKSNIRTKHWQKRSKIWAT